MIVMPKSQAGKWSLGLAAAALVVFIAWQIGLALEIRPEFGPPPVTVLNWNLVILTSELLCLAAAVTGLAGLIRNKERSVLVFIVTIGGFLIILTLIGIWLNLYLNPHQAPKRLPGL